MEDYIPEMKNPVIVEDSVTENIAFRPATKAVTVQHLLNFSSGLSYGTGSHQAQAGLGEAYSSKDMHQDPDPVSRFFQFVKVCMLKSVWTSK